MVNITELPRGPDYEEFLDSVKKLLATQPMQAVIITQTMDGRTNSHWLNLDQRVCNALGLLEWVKLDVYHGAHEDED